MPERTPEEIERLVVAELERITDLRVLTVLRPLLVSPTRHERDWDYGQPGERYPCWTVAEHPPSGTSIVFSDYGFGPRLPWGLVWIEGPWFGMDSGWFQTLQEAFLDSIAWAEAQ
jgi:hypothetical protein